nr:kirola-like [Ipomoea trifida]
MAVHVVPVSIEIEGHPRGRAYVKGYRPNQINTMSPDKIHGCDLHEDGKKQIAKEIIEAIDEEHKTVKFKVIEGDLIELYKSMSISVHVDTRGINNLVTWTIEFEKQNESIPEPHTLVQFVLALTKDIETHHLK